MRYTGLDQPAWKRALSHSAACSLAPGRTNCQHWSGVSTTSHAQKSPPLRVSSNSRHLSGGSLTFCRAAAAQTASLPALQQIDKFLVSRRVLLACLPICKLHQPLIFHWSGNFVISVRSTAWLPLLLFSRHVSCLHRIRKEMLANKKHLTSLKS